MADELVRIKFIKNAMLPGRNKHWTEKNMPAGAVVEVDKDVADAAIAKGLAKIEKKRKPMDKAEIAEIRDEQAKEIHEKKMAEIEAMKKLLGG